MHALLKTGSIHRLLLIVLAAVFSHHADAEAAGILRCFSTQFEPFVIESEGEIRGIDVEIVREAGKLAGIRVEFALMPWLRLEQSLKRGEVDCVAAYFRTAEREAYMLYTGVPLHITTYSLFVHREDARQSVPVEQIKGWRVGVNRGFKTTETFEKAVSEKRITPYELNNTKQGFDMLRRGRLEAVLTNRHVGQYLTREHHPGAFVALEPSLQATPAYLVFARRPEFEALVGRFDEALMKLMTDGTYQSIFLKYTQ